MAQGRVVLMAVKPKQLTGRRCPELVVVALDQAVARHVEVELGALVVGEDRCGEGHDERAVDALAVEDGKLIDQLARLQSLVAHVAVTEPERGAGVVDDRPAHAAGVLGAAIGTATDLGDDDRTSVGEVRADQLRVLLPAPAVPVRVDGHVVKQCPVDGFQTCRGIGDGATECLPGGVVGFSEKRVEGRIVRAVGCALQERRPADAFGDVVALEDALHEQRQFGSQAEHDLSRPVAAQPLRRVCSLGDVLERLLGIVLEQFRAEPRFQSVLQWLLGDTYHAADLSATDPDGVGVEVVADYLQLAAHDVHIEHGPRRGAAKGATSVVADSSSVHASSPERGRRALHRAPRIG